MMVQYLRLKAAIFVLLCAAPESALACAAESAAAVLTEGELTEEVAIDGVAPEPGATDDDTAAGVTIAGLLSAASVSACCCFNCSTPRAMSLWARADSAKSLLFEAACSSQYAACSAAS